MYMPWGGNTPPLKTGVMAYNTSTVTLRILQASRLWRTCSSTAPPSAEMWPPWPGPMAYVF